MSVASAAPNIISIVGPQEQGIYDEPTETPWSAEFVTYTNFSYNLVRLTTNGSGTYKEGTNSWNGHGNGDLVHTLYFELLTPAITANVSTSKATDCHFQNGVAWAAMVDASVFAGVQQCEKKHGRWMQAIIEYLYPPGKRFEELSGSYNSEPALIQAAKADCRYIAPVLLSQTRWTQCSVPSASAHHSTLQYKITLEKLANLVVNVGDDTILPYKYGTTTPLAPSDVYTNLYATCIFLDDAERSLLMVADLKYITTDTIENTVDIASGASAVDVTNPDLNHPTKYFMWFLQRNEAIDGSTYQRQKIGVKDKFCYAADHGGETIIEPNLLLNSQSVWPNVDLGPFFFRYLKVWESFPYCSENINGPKYFWTFGPKCDEWNSIKTLNMTRLETIKFKSLNNNTISKFTGGKFFLYTEVHNLLVCYGGVLGYIYGSSS